MNNARLLPVMVLAACCVFSSHMMLSGSLMETYARVRSLLEPSKELKTKSVAERVKLCVDEKDFSEKDVIELDDELVKTKTRLSRG
jgi:glutamine phosphoribosylpyrophosphate amidotransferase